MSEQDELSKDEQAYLLWFFQTADFGPAHSDVVGCLQECYTSETGNAVPETLDYFGEEE